MGWKKIIGWALGILFGLVVLGIVAGYFVLRSQAFQRYVIAKIEQTAAQATGGKVELQAFDFHLSGLTADAYGLVVHGTEPAGHAPLLTVDELTVRLKILSVLHHDVNLREIIVQHPVVHLAVAKDGRNNLPSPNASQQKSSHTDIFQLAIGHVLLTDGQIYYNDRQTPLNADVYDLGAEIRFDAAATQYNGRLAYNNGKLQYANYTSLPHDLHAQFSANRNTATLKGLDLRVGNSRVTLKATLTDYNAPHVDGTYSALLHTEDFAPMLKSASASASGDVALSGTLQYQSVEGQPVLKAVTLHGDVKSRELRVATPQARAALSGLSGQYQLADGNAQASAEIADLLNGRVTTQVDVRHLETTPAGRVRLNFSGLSLAAAKSAVPSLSANNVPVTGTAKGAADVKWVGDIAKMQAKADVNVRGALHPPAGAGPVPIDAAVHALYDGRTSRITLDNTSLKTPSATVLVKGTVSPRGNNLRLAANTRDVHDLVLLAKAFQSDADAQSKVPNVSGPAALNAVVTGTSANPEISAQLVADNLQVEGTRWRIVRLNAQASPSQVQILNGVLTNARRGDIRFSGTVGLDKWSFTPESPITANATVRQMPVSELQQLAKVNYPVSGVLAADISLHGTQLDPVGHGSVQLLKASAYDQPIQNLSARFQAANGTINSQLNLKIAAGTAEGQLDYTPRTKAYRVQFNAPGIVLHDLQAVQAKNVPVQGTLTATASGAGTLDDPKLQATVQIPQLQLKQTTVTGVRADLDVADHKAGFTLGSDLAQATIRARGSVDLTGGYNTNATLDTTRIPLDPLLAAYLSNFPSGASSEIELHATVKGPLKDKNQLEAHLTIPTFDAQYQQVRIANHGPIRVDYVHSVVTVEPSELQGTDSSLRIQGRVPLQSTQAIDLTAKGNVNLKLLRLFMPDTTTAGRVVLDLRGSGNAAKPDVEGQVQLQKVAYIPADAPLGIENLNGTLDVANGQVRIRQLTGQSGGGEISLGGTASYQPSPHFDLAIQAKSVRLLYPTGLRTILDGNLTASGSPAASTINGRVLIDSIAFTQDFDLAKFISNSNTPSVPSATPTAADTMKLDIAVQSTSDLEATSSTVSLQGSANLRIIGTAADPVIVGRADLNSGDVFFNSQRFVLERGIVNFINPHQTEPNVNILITTTIQQYNLSLTILGPVDKLRTNYTSDPPLPPVDIINLIALGQTTEQPSAPFDPNQVIAGQLASQVSSRVSKFAGISSLTIDPTLGSNNQDPTARIAIQQRVTRNFVFTFSTDVTMPQAEIVQGEYQLNKRWSVSASRDQYGGFAVDGRYHSTF